MSSATVVKKWTQTGVAVRNLDGARLIARAHRGRDSRDRAIHSLPALQKEAALSADVGELRQTLRYRWQRDYLLRMLSQLDYNVLLPRAGGFRGSVYNDEQQIEALAHFCANRIASASDLPALIKVIAEDGAARAEIASVADSLERLKTPSASAWGVANDVRTLVARRLTWRLFEECLSVLANERQDLVSPHRLWDKSAAAQLDMFEMALQRLRASIETEAIQAKYDWARSLLRERKWQISLEDHADVPNLPESQHATVPTVESEGTLTLLERKGY